MSAIAGIVSVVEDGSVSEIARRMTNILAHRGSDGFGLWSGSHSALGHRMLRTTRESLLECLPLTSVDGDFIITADARLDNRDELSEKLGLPDSPDPITDAFLILAAYRKWDLRCPEELLGDFAFAIWDQQKDRLFCARDHFGVKPFYFYYSEKVFLFASEIKALFCDPRVPKRLDEIRIADHLVPLSSDPEITFYQGIRRLPPGNSMTVGRGGIRFQTYWSLNPEFELQLSSDEEYAEALREIFIKAVECRLRSAFPVGSLLSGGLDSSSITCVARQLLKKAGKPDLPTFSAIFDRATTCDERRFIEAVLAPSGLNASYVHADSVSPLIDVEKILWHQDQAVAAGNLYINWCLYDKASSHGVRVLLDGFDGDTAVSHGTGYLIELAHARRWFSLAKEVKAYSNKLQTSWLAAYWAWVKQYGIKPMTANGRTAARLRKLRQLVRGSTQGSEAPESVPAHFLNSTFARRIGLEERRQQARSRKVCTERQNHYRLLTWAMIPDTLEALDKVGAAFSIEPRYPFWDKRIAEFCLALPSEQKMRHGWTRVVMRRAMTGILPQPVQWRADKSNLAPSLERGLLDFERSRLEELELQHFALLQDYVDVPSLRRAYFRFLSGTATETEALAVWRSLSLAVWLQQTKFCEPPSGSYPCGFLPRFPEKGGDRYGAA